MEIPALKHRHTLQEYLTLEETSDVKHEFHDGEILAMSGGTYEHSRINAKLVGEIGSALKGSPCFVLESNMRVRIPKPRIRVYPDASVVCGEPAFDPEDKKHTTITNPRAVFEVLSDSTEEYDRGLKFEYYRALESLEYYVLVSQDRPLIEVLRRDPDGTWQSAVASGITAVATLPTLNVSLALADIYAGISFPPAESGDAAGASTASG